MATTDLNRLLTPSETAEALRISRQTVLRMANDGRPPAVRVGGQLRIVAAELQDWIDSHRWFNGGKQLDNYEEF